MKPNDINTILPHLFMRIIIKQKDRIKKCGPLKNKIFFVTCFTLIFLPTLFMGVMLPLKIK